MLSWKVKKPFSSCNSKKSSTLDTPKSNKRNVNIVNRPSSLFIESPKCLERTNKIVFDQQRPKSAEYSNQLSPTNNKLNNQQLKSERKKVWSLLSKVHSSQSTTRSTSPTIQLSFRGKNHAPISVWSGLTASDLPCVNLSKPTGPIFSAVTGPDSGLQPYLTSHHHNTNTNFIWNRLTSRKADGSVQSLYETNPNTGQVRGDPNADAYFIVARSNCSLLAIADGVNHGEFSCKAARAALAGAWQYLQSILFYSEENEKCEINSNETNIKWPQTTQEAIELLLSAVGAAQTSVVEHTTIGWTTLTLVLVLPLAPPSCHFAVCCVIVGDSLAFLLSKHHGLREITAGNHLGKEETRILNDAGGALGAVYDNNLPELHNLTCCLTFCDPGDLVFITSDGVSDNFDPVVRRKASPLLTQLSFIDSDDDDDDDNDNANASHNANDKVNYSNETEIKNNKLKAIQIQICISGKRCELNGIERRVHGMKEMERVWHNEELNCNENRHSLSAREYCQALQATVYRRTQKKRHRLEDRGLYRGNKARCKALQAIAEQETRCMKGKLDHASVVAYDVGFYRGNDYEVYEDTTDWHLYSSSPTVSWPDPPPPCGSQ